MRRVSMRLWIIGFCLTTLWGGVAMSDEPLTPGRLDPFWKGLAFGVTKQNVVQFLKDRIASRYEAEIKNTMDVRERDRLTREMGDLVNQVGKDFVSFDGKTSGWEVSVIRNEFSHGNDEELLDLLHGKEHVYLFFTGGVYYKMIRTGVNRPTSRWLEEMEQEYGKPGKVVYLDKENRSGIRSARWKEGLLTVELDDKTRLFQCVTIRWALSAADRAVKAVWRGSGNAGSGLNPLVREASEPSARELVNPVDEILGRTPTPDTPPKKRRNKRSKRRR